VAVSQQLVGTWDQSGLVHSGHLKRAPLRSSFSCTGMLLGKLLLVLARGQPSERTESMDGYRDVGSCGKVSVVSVMGFVPWLVGGGAHVLLFGKISSCLCVRAASLLILEVMV